MAAGASRETVYVAEVDTMPLQYVANQVRVIVRAVGELSPDGLPANGAAGTSDDEGETDEDVYTEAEKDRSAPDGAEEAPAVDIDGYRPTVVKNPETGVDEWIISELDLEWLADGCYVLGCAGGGSPFSEYLRLRDQIRAGYEMRVIDASSLKDDALVYCT